REKNSNSNAATNKWRGEFFSLLRLQPVLSEIQTIQIAVLPQIINSIDSLCAENSSVSSEPISLAAIDSNYIGNNPHCSTNEHTCVDSPLPESPYSRSEYPRTQSNEEDSTDKSVSIITKEHKLLTGIVQGSVIALLLMHDMSNLYTSFKLYRRNNKEAQLSSNPEEAKSLTSGEENSSVYSDPTSLVRDSNYIENGSDSTSSAASNLSPDEKCNTIDSLKPTSPTAIDSNYIGNSPCCSTSSDSVPDENYSTDKSVRVIYQGEQACNWNSPVVFEKVKSPRVKVKRTKWNAILRHIPKLYFLFAIVEVRGKAMRESR
ncbi:LOW QUALITY PROTEIN: hypothetical protein HID58_074068, partial [Brassica napus]